MSELEDHLRHSISDPDNEPADAAQLLYINSLSDEDLVGLLKDVVVVAAMRLVGDPTHVSTELKFESVNRVLTLLKEFFNNAKPN